MNNYFSAAPNAETSPQQRQEYMREQERRDASLDEALRFTFPASDPVALSCSVTTFLAPKREQLRVSIEFFKRTWANSRP